MSRNEGESTEFRRRPARTVPALVVAVLFLGTGVALAWLCIARLVDGTWSTILATARDWLASLTWNDSTFLAIGAVAVAVGVILLLCAVVPGGFNALAVRNITDEDSDPRSAQEKSAAFAQETVMTRRGVAHLARAQCVQVDGVSTATVTATAKKVHLRVRTSLRETSQLRILVTDAVRDRLAAVGIDPLPDITATIESRD